MICPNCHKEVASGSTFCGYCGYRLVGVKQITPHNVGGTFTTPQRADTGPKYQTTLYKGNTQGQKGGKDFTKIISKKGVIIIVLAIVIISLLWILFGGKGKPKKDMLLESIPDDYLEYLIDGERFTAQAADLEFERRETEDGNDEAYCKVKLVGPQLTREAYLIIKSRYYKQGGWFVESVYPYNASVVTNVDETYCAQRLQKAIASGFTDDTIDSCNVISNSITYNPPTASFEFDISKRCPNAIVSGKVIGNGTLVTDPEPANFDSYIWECNADFSQADFNFDFDLNGHWHCDGDSDEIYNIDIYIQHTPGENTFTWSGEWYQKEYHGWSRPEVHKEYHDMVGTISYDYGPDSEYIIFEEGSHYGPRFVSMQSQLLTETLEGMLVGSMIDTYYEIEFRLDYCFFNKGAVDGGGIGFRLEKIE